MLKVYKNKYKHEIFQLAEKIFQSLVMKSTPTCHSPPHLHLFQLGNVTTQFLTLPSKKGGWVGKIISKNGKMVKKFKN